MESVNDKMVEYLQRLMSEIKTERECGADDTYTKSEYISCACMVEEVTGKKVVSHNYIVGLE